MASRVETQPGFWNRETVNRAALLALLVLDLALLGGPPLVSEIRRILDSRSSAAPISAPVPEVPPSPTATPAPKEPEEIASYRIGIIGNIDLDSEEVLRGAFEKILRYYQRPLERRYQATLVFPEKGGRVALIYDEDPFNPPIYWQMPIAINQNGEIGEFASEIDGVAYAVNSDGSAVVAVVNPSFKLPDPETAAGEMFFALTSNGSMLVEGEVVNRWSLNPPAEK